MYTITTRRFARACAQGFAKHDRDHVAMVKTGTVASHMLDLVTASAHDAILFALGR